ncbi:MAG: DUF202 domain-containing protein [Gammaproteobacteria bacterium]|jgi:hypothetical protein|nr:DUF202 domain-containing protein [Gammaproteobacteria bacterium]MBT5203200.1 DUF202 domain-containing protein [Gammaproteobacteria bacterium]MBT5603703.1 DUF202 domain-containing protein [Gammaproteobacteria bacterium]MBT6247276.1 DUF202 domain-containing protein [Gammaproteobacteria bacterium]
MELLIPIFAICGAFLTPVLIIWIYFTYTGRTEERFHTTLQQLIKSDQTITPDMMKNIPGYKEVEQKQRNDLRRGIITVSVGAGIAIFGAIGLDEEVFIGFGLLVATIGLGLLIYGIYQKQSQLGDPAG